MTLEEDGVARFPDAPTERGAKHVQELQKAVSEGYEAWILFVIQMADMKQMEPNTPRDPQFAQALWTASQNGVHVRAVECRVTADSLEITGEVPVCLPVMVND